MSKSRTEILMGVLSRTVFGQGIDWHQASDELDSIGKAAVPDLLKILQTKREPRDLLYHTASRLGKYADYTDDSPEIRKALCVLLKYDDIDVRVVASKALANIGAADLAIPAIIKQLMEEDLPERILLNPMDGLRKLGPKAIKALSYLLVKHPKWTVRSSAAKALGALGESAASTTGVLTKAILAPKKQNVDAKSRCDMSFVFDSAAEALGNIGPAANDAVPTLIEAMFNKGNHFNGSERVKAAMALWKICRSQQALEQLHIWAKDKSFKSYPTPKTALSSLGIEAQTSELDNNAPITKETIVRDRKVGDWLKIQFSKESPGLSPAAALASVGTQVMPHIMPMIDQGGYPNTERAAEILSIMPFLKKDCIAEVISLLKSSKDNRFNCACDVIFLWHKEDFRDENKKALEVIARKAVPILEGYLRSSNRHDKAVWTLGYLGEEAHSSVPYLVHLAQDKQVSGQKLLNYARVISRIGPSPEAAPVLIAALQDCAVSDKGIIEEILEGLAKTGKAAAPAISIVEKYLRSSYPGIRWNAIYVFKEIGHAPDSVLKILQNMVEEDERHDGKYAAEALEKIDQTIRWKCVSCDKNLCTSHKHIGKKVKCPRCNKVQMVPTGRSKADSLTQSASSEKYELSTIDVDQLVEELIVIGAAVEDSSFGSSGFFLRAWDGGVKKHQRAREIGKILHKLGGMNMMRSVHHTVVNRLGRLPARELEACWGGIGEWLP